MCICQLEGTTFDSPFVTLARVGLDLDTSGINGFAMTGSIILGKLSMTGLLHKTLALPSSSTWSPAGKPSAQVINLSCPPKKDPIKVQVTWDYLFILSNRFILNDCSCWLQLFLLSIHLPSHTKATWFLIFSGMDSQGIKLGSAFSYVFGQDFISDAEMLTMSTSICCRSTMGTFN